MLPEARLAYWTCGSPDAPRGAALVPSHFIAGAADDDFLIGERVGPAHAAFPAGPVPAWLARLTDAEGRPVDAR